MSSQHKTDLHSSHTGAMTTGLLILIVVLILFLMKSHMVHQTPITETQDLMLPQQEFTQPKEDLSQPNEKWVHLTAQTGDSLSKLFQKVGLDNATLSRLMKETSHQKDLNELAPGDELNFKIAKDKRLLQLVLYLTLKEKLTITQQDNDHFYEKVDTLAVQRHAHYISATVEHSLYYTLKKHNIPQALLKQLVDIFATKIDFNREVRDNDTFTIIYDRIYIDEEHETLGHILAASFTNRHHTYYAIGYRDQQGKMAYYSPEGQNLALGFDRYPIHFTHVGSIFNLHRYHPILHVERAHKGIDLAASIGTPIRAVADGYINQIGVNGGYGNMIKIRHSRRYETVYAHMLRFKKGLSRGTKVQRGDIIGYVGQTGLATAPHCHYEFRISGRSVNPATVTLPNAPGVRKTQLRKFRSQADSLLSQLKLYQEASQNG